MKERTRLKLKIVSSFTMCALSLFSIVSLTFSWFAVNDNANGNGMLVTGGHDTDVVGYEFFALKKDVSGYALTATGNFPTLGVYDALNDDYALVLKIYLDLGAENKTVKLFAETTATYFLGDNVKLDDGSEISYPLLPPRTDDTSRPLDGGKNYTNSLTSVVAVTVLGSGEVTAVKNDNRLTALPSIDRLSTFIDLDEANADGTHTPKSSVPILQDGNAEIELTREIYKGVERDAVYVYITYDALLINTVFSANIGNEDMYLSDGDGLPLPIPFACDFSITADIF